MASVLVVDDDVSLLNIVAFVLRQEGFEVSTAEDGEEAIRKARADNPNALVLDLVLPKRDGFEVCQSLRSFSSLPILMLTAVDDENDKIRGLELGADDYMTKPFSVRELVARVKALLRRADPASSPPTSSLTVGDLSIDFATRTVTTGQGEVRLTPTEFKLLQSLAVRPGTVLSPQTLARQIYGFECSEQEAQELIKVAVRRLRRKIEPYPESPQYILNVRGFGYALGKPSPSCAPMAV